MLEKENIYLIGAGGIGMSALARYFLHAGKNVGGYDRNRSSLCEQLETEGVQLHYQDEVKFIPDNFRDASNTLVIFTPAVPAEHNELGFFKNQNFRLAKRAEVLGAISRAHKCLAVAGTHGKTTTSALLAHIIKNAGHPLTAFLGGIATNYQSNFLADQSAELLVAEADEYDRSFLNLSPAGAIITSVDSDHLDIYGDAEELRNTFSVFAAAVDGPLIVHKKTELKGLTYAIDEPADFQIRNIRIEEHRYLFDIKLKDQELIENVASGLPGRHNVENALAASALAFEFGIGPREIQSGIETFRGVKRRFEYHIKRDDLVYIDDYAHHPEEINALLSSVRELYPDKKLTAIFQPHLYSRTRDYMEEFAEALSKADELILMDIYPAREKPIPGINSQRLLDLVDSGAKKLLSVQEILNELGQSKPELVVSMGAGDIDQIVNPLKVKLSQ